MSPSDRDYWVKSVLLPRTHLQLFFFGSCPLTFHIPEHSTEPHCHGAIHTVPVRTLSRAVSIRGDARKQLPSSPASGWLTGPQALTASPSHPQETLPATAGYLLKDTFYHLPSLCLSTPKCSSWKWLLCKLFIEAVFPESTWK